MSGQRVNRYSSKSGFNPALARYLKASNPKPIHDTQTGFIHHPTGFPLEFKKVRFHHKQDNPGTASGEIGLIFETEKYVKPGTTLEVTIPLRQETAQFRGKVVLVKNNGNHFEIGLWLKHASDASRVRIVEQICHIEAYLKEKKLRDGPFSLNRERIAAEWISKNASNVPSL